MSDLSESGAHAAADWKSVLVALVKLFGVLMAATWPILLGVSSWAGAKLLDHENRIVMIEASRYTTKDAKQDRERRDVAAKEIASSLTEIKVALAKEQAESAQTRERLSAIDRKLDKVADAVGRGGR